MSLLLRYLLLEPDFCVGAGRPHERQYAQRLVAACRNGDRRPFGWLAVRSVNIFVVARALIVGTGCAYLGWWLDSSAAVHGSGGVAKKFKRVHV